MVTLNAADELIDGSGGNDCQERPIGDGEFTRMADSGACALVAKEGPPPNHTSAVSNHSSDDRLDAVWAAVEREYEANNNKRASPPQSPPTMGALGEGSISTAALNGDGVVERHYHEENISPLMAHPSDATLQTSNRASSTLVLNQTTDEFPPIIENQITTPNHEEQQQSSSSSSNQIIIPEKQQKQTTLIQKYRHFLQKHQPSLDLLESIMERFVFYGYLFKHDHRGISTELYYAAWNIIRWANDVVLVGWGEGMGITFGKREEWLLRLPRSLTSLDGDASPTRAKKIKNNTLSELVLAKMNSAVPILRAILTATTCVYPAMEAWSRRSPHSQHPAYGTPLSLYSSGDDDTQTRQQQFQQEYQLMATTSADSSPHKRQSDWEARQSRAANVSCRLERIKFLSRLALLSISWWAQYERRKKSQDDDDSSDDKRKRKKKREKTLLPSLLRRGGELDPYEQLVPLKDVEDEAKVVQYVGRRTGRRSISRASSAIREKQPPQQPSDSIASSISSIGSTFVKWLSKQASSKNRILYIYAVGELLHILRPFYWSNAEKKEWKSKSSSARRLLPHNNSKTSYSFGLWKAWWISLLMDLISDKLLQLTHDGASDTQSTANVTSQQRRGSFLGRPGGKNNHRQQQQSLTSLSPSAEQAKLEELEWRRSRHTMYLLRSPMYNAVTRPLATFIGKIVSMIPSFGLGQWAAEYVLDMMSYWNDNRFMLES